MSGVVFRDLGQAPLAAVWDEMQRFTDARTADTPDEIWFVEHPPIFTLGLNAKDAHVIDAGDIPVLRVDRGGQVTYHGPGQVVAYTLIDLKRRKLTVRSLVELLESVIIETVARHGIEAYGRRDAPGVYVGEAKLAAVGLRVRRNCAYHGIAVNVSMDLMPFERINPCGFEGLQVTQLSALCGVDSLSQVRAELQNRFERALA